MGFVAYFEVMPKGYRHTWFVCKLKPDNPDDDAWDWRGENIEHNDSLKYLHDKYGDREDVIAGPSNGTDRQRNGERSTLSPRYIFCRGLIEIDDDGDDNEKRP